MAKTRESVEYKIIDQTDSECSDGASESYSVLDSDESFKCGIVLLVRNKSLIKLICQHCGGILEKLEHFISHILQFHLSATEDEIDSFMSNLYRQQVEEDADTDLKCAEGIASDNEQSFERISCHNEELNEDNKILNLVTNYESFEELDINQYNNIYEEIENTNDLTKETNKTEEYSVESFGITPNKVINNDEDGSHNKTFSLSKRTRKKNVSKLRGKMGDSSNTKCDICDTTFTTAYSLKLHLYRHFDIKNHGCQICEKRFVTKIDLRRHMLIHTGDRPYSCKQCGKTYKTSAQMTIHRRSHNNERPFQCNICNKSFYSSTLLRSHKIVHTGDRPYVCKECGFSYMRSNALQLHIDIKHAKLKPFECEVCHQKFSKKTILNYHMKKHTENQFPKQSSRDKIHIA